MNLKELNSIAAEGKDFLSKADELERKIAYLVQTRQSMRTVSQVIKGMSPNDSRFLSGINNEVVKIVDSFSHDIFRVIEMKMASEARELRCEAKLKNMQINAFLPDNQEKNHG